METVERHTVQRWWADGERTVAGLVTRILSKHPGLTAFQVKAVLHALADNAAPPGPAAGPAT